MKNFPECKTDHLRQSWKEFVFLHEEDDFRPWFQAVTQFVTRCVRSAINRSIRQQLNVMTRKNTNVCIYKRPIDLFNLYFAWSLYSRDLINSGVFYRCINERCSKPNFHIRENKRVIWREFPPKQLKISKHRKLPCLRLSTVTLRYLILLSAFLNPWKFTLFCLRKQRE